MIDVPQGQRHSCRFQLEARERAVSIGLDDTAQLRGGEGPVAHEAELSDDVCLRSSESGGVGWVQGRQRSPEVQGQDNQP